MHCFPCCAVLGSGTSSSTIAFGSVRAYGGAVPTGVTKSINGTSWTLSTPIDVRVTKTRLGSSANYAMTAQLQTPSSWLLTLRQHVQCVHVFDLGRGPQS